MTTDPVYYVGGLRARLLNDSIFAMLNDCLSRLNWFNPNRGYTPINFVTGQQDIRSAIPFNTLAFSSENESEVDWELGSNLSEHHQNYLIDFFAESEALSVHLTRDIADILKGRYPQLGRFGPVVQVYDYQQDPPPPIFYVDIEQIRVDRAHNWSEPYLQYWRSVSFVALDYYDLGEVPGPPAMARTMGSGTIGSGAIGE